MGVTLRGKVLPIGGVKEKVLAAHRIGLKTVLLPTRNQVDLEDIPDEVREEIQFVFTDSVRDAIDAALMPVDKKKFKKSKKKQNPNPRIRKRGNRHNLEVRMNGQSISKTFSTLTEAKAWRREQETKIDKGGCGDHQ